MEKMICILPTGDWAEINANNLPRFVGLTTEHMEQLSNGELDIDDLHEVLS
jgi:hypothetical protein